MTDNTRKPGGNGTAPAVPVIESYEDAADLVNDILHELAPFPEKLFAFPGEILIREDGRGFTLPQGRKMAVIKDRVNYALTRLGVLHRMPDIITVASSGWAFGVWSGIGVITDAEEARGTAEKVPALIKAWHPADPVTGRIRNGRVITAPGAAAWAARPLGRQ